MMHRCIRTVCGAVMFLHASAALAGGAAFCLALSELFSGSLTVGDKSFDEWTYTGSGNMPTAGSIDVCALVDDGGFRLQGAFLDMPGGDVSSALVEFRVTAAGPSGVMSGAQLAGNPFVAGPSGLIQATTTFLPEIPDATLAILADGVGVQLADEIGFRPLVDDLHVQISILGSAGASAVTLGFLEQKFRSPIFSDGFE